MLNRNCFLELYEKAEYIKNLNFYNKKTISVIGRIKRSLSLPFFSVPYLDIKKVWGIERIFYCFTDKLFKILYVNFSDTSLQYHVLKNEKWYPLEKSFINDGKTEWVVNQNMYIDIPKYSLHCIKKGSVIFEVQDNYPFDNIETIRIKDINNRKLAEKSIISKYIKKNYENNLNIKKRLSNTFINLKRDIFIFSIEDVEIKVYFLKKKKSLKLKKNHLYYFNSKFIKFIFIRNKDSIVFCEANFFIRMSNVI